MKKIALLYIVSSMFLQGCSMLPLVDDISFSTHGRTSPSPKVENKIDVQPILVPNTMEEKLLVSSKEIRDQLDLLMKVSTGNYGGSYNVVRHNNLLDARLGSSNTLPQAYGQFGVGLEKDASIMTQTYSPVIMNPGVQQNKIRRIIWNGSLNELLAGFAQVKGYNLVFTSKKDRNIQFKVENETVDSAISRLRGVLENTASINISDKNKTIYVHYMK